MTAQISDTFTYNNESYWLIGMEGKDPILSALAGMIGEGGIFSPSQLGMEAEMLHTACYRGFYCEYELTDEALLLRKLTMREKNGRYLPIGGVKAAVDGYQGVYDGLSVTVTFTGRIRLAKGLVGQYHINMGYPKASAFETVLDITLEEGRVVSVIDRSQEMERKRGAFKEEYEKTNDMKTIQDAFSLGMDEE